MNKILVLFVCFAGLEVLSGSVSAVTPVTGCGALSTAGETYVLQNDISASGTCFTIDADNITLDGAGYSIKGSGGGTGVYLNGRSGVTVKNLTVKNFDGGIYLKSSSNNSIEDNNASDNTWEGIVIYNSSNNTITGNNANGNGLDDMGGGIVLVSSSNNTIINNTANSNNDYGIRLSSYSNYNTIANNTANSNIWSGIRLSRSSSNNLINNTASNNEYGIGLHWDSDSNTLTNNTASSNNYEGIGLGFSSSNTLTGNTVSNNDWYGIYLGFSSSNTISNNYFNNTNNFYFSGTIYANDWNTTKTAGKNIIGGPYLGGNFWATPGGTGFSETCMDADGDGICDLSYTLASGNVDYLPLVTDTTPPGHVNTTVIQRLDYYFNVTWTIPPDPDLKEFNIYERQNDNSSTDTLIDTVPANYVQPHIAGPGNNSTDNLYQYMVTAVDTSGNEGNGTYAPDTPVPPIPFAPLGTLLTLGSGLVAYGYYRRKTE